MGGIRASDTCMKVLLIGDIVGQPGRKAVSRLVPSLRRELALDLVIGNAENAAGGAGLTPATADELIDAGIDVLTSGNHIWRKPEIHDRLISDARVLRPANYPPSNPGRGVGVYRTASGKPVGVINVIGRVFMPDHVDCPFRVVEQAVAEVRRQTSIILVDVHADATSEKVAMGWFLDGKVSGVFGTHTHIQTADERLLPQGTAYITDIGMTGPYDSVIGRKTEQILQRFLLQQPMRSEVAEGNVQLRGALVDIDPVSGRAVSIERIDRRVNL